MERTESGAGLAKKTIPFNEDEEMVSCPDPTIRDTNRISRQKSPHQLRLKKGMFLSGVDTMFVASRGD